MKKVININFQGRVIPIEETAFELLKQYTESLRRYFANEEGRDEIINDIESRIAELCSERLKAGSICITDADVNTIIGSMGRPEDFEAQDADSGTTSSTTASGFTSDSSYQSTGPTPVTGSRNTRGRFYRNADDKIIGGVCSGLANYFGIDPVILRILFVVLFGGLFWVYILLWIIVPSQSIESNITKRLYRNPDGKVIAGVAGGLAAYFNIETWIPRLIFALPFILALVSGSFNILWWDNDMGFIPRMISGSLGSTLFVTYIILWIAVPFANTAAEKLEMKGERINLNSIRDTVKEDLESLKTRAEKFGAEVKDTAQNFGRKAGEFGQQAGQQARTFAATEVRPVARRTRSGIGRAIGIIFKAFFLFVAGIIALGLFAAFIGLLFGGFTIFPLKNFVLEGFWQNLLAWCSLFLFFGVPIVALVTWLVRRIAGWRSKTHYLGYIFGSLWVIGLITTLILAGSMARSFRTRSAISEKVPFMLDGTSKIYVQTTNTNIGYYGSDWYGIEQDDDWPVYGLNQDTLLLKTVRVNLVKSADSSYHLYKVKFGRGADPASARMMAEKIQFDIQQQDSSIILPRHFSISRGDKWRNQQVMVVIEIPVGKKIQMDNSLNLYHWFNVNSDSRRGWNIQFDDNDWNNGSDWGTGVEYIMTTEGLVKTEDLDQKELKNGKFKMKINDQGVDIEIEGSKDKNDSTNSDYRYRQDADSTKNPANIKIKVTETGLNTEAEGYDEEATGSVKLVSELGTPLSVFSNLFQ
jgi:phage shock protein PspC (stress-responsive transcriptional regulator)